MTALHQSQVTCGEAGQHPHPQQRGPGGDAQGGHVLLLHLLVITVLYCTVLYCTVLLLHLLVTTVLYCTAPSPARNHLYCTVLYCTVLLLHLLVTTDPDGAEGHLPLQAGHYAAVESPGPV